ncbi:unnamed protein product [Rotaria magnacalcarata]|uniref:Reverse transcriptase domain-containing protein n=1 Tax=Rotaria magnacalcarata TaxID=392030 RepID=A0A816TDJ6_9BILA|nr:unnamed protein product [Rotaria magnacalcarata]
MGYQMTLDANITYILKKGQYVLRVTDKSGIFHIGHAADYAKKAEAYRKKTCAYIELDSDPLWSVFDKVILLLNGLRAKKHILSWQLDKMIPKREKVQSAYLYFIPKPHKIGTPLRPIVSSLHMPTTGISKFLDKLIRPLFDKYARSTTIIDGVDLIQRLEAYATNGYLNPTTYFCTFDITDLYIMLPQEESFYILTEFLLQYGYHKIQNIPIDAIRKLAPIVIKENGFPYENIFYRQVIGGALGSVFTLTLANILMWKWEKQLVHRLTISNEIYGRSVPFLDVLIENRKGTLTTSVYHKEADEPYVVPFRSDHPSHVFRNTIDTAIIRAVRYSTNLSQFEEEMRQIKLMLLYNGYPPIHIDCRTNRLFTKYLFNSYILPMLINSDDFSHLRHEFLLKSKNSINNAATRNPTIAGQAHLTYLKNQVEHPTEDNELITKRHLIIHYWHEIRLRKQYQSIRELWSRTVQGTETIDTALIIGTSLNPNLKQELITKNIQTDSRFVNEARE